MIELRSVSKVFHMDGISKTVLRDVSYCFPSGQSVALLGGNGAGKSTLLKMIGGTMQPDSGEILFSGSISWPVGFAGSFHPELSGAHNVAFVARIYGIDTDETIRFCREFAEIGEHFRLPVRTYSSGMKSRLAFAVSMAIPFDTYLIDEVMAVGDASFRTKCQSFLGERLKTAGGIIVTHTMPEVRRLCTAGLFLADGKLHAYDDVGKAIEHYQFAMRGEQPPWLDPEA